jgi:hypothetical protein
MGSIYSMDTLEKEMSQGPKDGQSKTDKISLHHTEQFRTVINF